jgi:cyclohexyl-isocyanide hydratase
MANPPLRIGIPIYTHVDLIDVAVPFDILSRIPSYWTERPLELDIVGPTCDPIVTDQGIVLTPTKTFAEYDANPLSVILVPGSQHTDSAINDGAYMTFVKVQAAKAEVVMSVCTGALILSAAGLLDGYRATTHWIALDYLRKNPNVQVVNGYPRWVHDRNRITAGGVSSSADAAFYLVSVLTNDQTAKCAQLITQYHPQPPFNTGDPAVADPDTYFKVMSS